MAKKLKKSLFRKTKRNLSKKTIFFSSFVLLGISRGYVFTVVALKQQEKKYLFVIDQMNSRNRLKGDELQQLKDFAKEIFSDS